MKMTLHFSKTLILFFLAFSFYGNPLFSQVLGDYKSAGTGTWSALSSWRFYNGTTWVTPTGTNPQGYPGQFAGTGSVLIQAGNVITDNVSTPFLIGAITINGQLNIIDVIKLVVTNNFNVNSGGIFNMPGGSGLATLIVYGNYINSGTTDFWKSIVVIVGDLLSPSTSSIQANGNVFVAGNIIGDFSTTGGTVANQIYALNPNATVTITPQSIDNMVLPGVVPTILTENQAIVDLVNLTVYGSTCVLANTGPTNVIACSGTNATFSVSTTATSPSFQWQVNSGASWVDVSAISFPYPYLGATSNNFTISNVLIGMNNYKFRAKITAGLCTKYGDFGTLTVNASPSALVNGLITLPTNGSNNGSIVLSGLPPSWVLTQTGVSNASFTGTSSPFTVSGLGVGTYYFTVSNYTCVSIATTLLIDMNKIWNGSINTDWNTAKNWTPNGVPTKDNTIIIPDVANDPIISGTYFVAFANNLTVYSGGSLLVNPTNTITVTDFVHVNPGGTLIFENTASLVQINDAALNSGNIIYKRITPVIANNYDFEYWGSPIFGQKLGTIWMASNWNDTFYNYDSLTTNDWVRNVGTDSMIPGKGYISRARNGQFGLDYNNVSATFTVGGTWTAKFYGVPNNGIINVANITSGNYCLLGNPYPSAISADKFLSLNTGLVGTIYFWTHNTVLSNNAYSSNDYATYNGVGGTATTAKSLSTGLNTNVPSGQIAAGQGFLATAVTSNNVVFNNSMRVAGSSNTNTQFFKTANAKTTNIIEKDRLWLNLSNNQGVFKQTLVGYITDATNDFDSIFDGESIDGNSFVDFYSVLQSKNLAIQGRALPFDVNDVVPLGFRSSINGNYTINIDQVDGVLANKTVLIEDKLNNTVTDLKSGNYTFDTAAGTFNDRFVLKYSNPSKTLVTQTFNENDILTFYSNSNKILNINNKMLDSTINFVSLYSVSGQSILNLIVKDIDQTNIQIPIKDIRSGIYIAKLITTKGEFNKKIIVN